MKNLLQRLRRAEDERGDTIVEVLIAVAVVSFLLAGAYSLSSRSVKTLTDAQERGQALSVASAQVEYLRAANAFSATSDCFNPAGVAVTASGASCNYNSAGQNGCTAATSSYCYDVQITPVASSSGGNSAASISTTYKIAVTWDSLLGNTSNVTLFYRIDIPNLAYVSGGGGDSAAIGSTGCAVSGTCGMPGGGSYHYTAGFTVMTSIPSNQIASCLWDFDDGTTKAYPTPAGCSNGDTLSHNYKDAPQMQSLPPWPAACQSAFLPPDSTANGRTAFTVTMVITKTDGSRVATQPYIVRMPQCWL